MSHASLPANSGAGGHGQSVDGVGLQTASTATPADGTWSAPGGATRADPVLPPPMPPTQRAPAPAPSPAAKPRSCITCRQRKVRCDKLSPCSNCRRADIQCVVPSLERPPRWARRMRQQQEQQRQTTQQNQPLLSKKTSPSTLTSSPHAPSSSSHSARDVNSVLERLRNLEDLVRELGRASEAPRVPTHVAQAASDPGRAAQAGVARSDQDQSMPVQERLGRLILDDDTSSRSRYVSSGFWSKINDELDDLRLETASLADEEESGNNDYGPDLQEAPGQRRTSSGEPSRPPEERHAFLFGHARAPAWGSIAAYRPLPSQIPFLFQVYLTNVNPIIQVIHVPTVRKMIAAFLEEGTGAEGELSLSNEALLFAIYHAAVASMGEEEVTRNFASPKGELILRFRRGFEVALARADFLNTADIVLVQALSIFLILVRRYDSPRFVWMMTGLLIRMGLALGLQRDGSSFGTSLTPYEVEIRRRAWWTLVSLDVRSSEDQGSELTIAPDSFSTRLPLNINDDDLSELTKAMPVERKELTDMTHALLNMEMSRLSQNMMALAAKAMKQQGQQPGSGDGPHMTPGELMAEHARMLEEIYQRLDDVYLQYSPNMQDVTYWTGMTCTHLFLSKMTLIVYLPTFLRDRQARTQQQTAEEQTAEDSKLRCRLLNCAIEVAEFYHALNVEPAGRRLRWLFETYTQWHAIAYLLIETGRAPWDPTVERAWVALHSPYLIPAALRDSGDSQRFPTSRAAAASTGAGMGAGAGPKGSGSSAGTDNWTQLFWLPMRRMMARARRHRAAELARLRVDTLSARSLDIAYETTLARGRSHPLSNPDAVDLFRDRWRKLVGLDTASPPGRPSSVSGTAPASEHSTSNKPTPPAPSTAETGGPATAQQGSSPASGSGNKHLGQAGSGNTASLGPAANAHAKAGFSNASTYGVQPADIQPQQILHCNENSHTETMSRNLYDPWPSWGGLDSTSGMAGGSGAPGNVPPTLGNDALGMGSDVDADMAMDMGLDADMDWGNWFASIRDLERAGPSEGF